jgi:hypothetical protein
MEKTFRGSCHCGAVAFECDVDLSKGTSRCNCSICGKTRFWKAIVAPSAFRLTKGSESLTEYRFASKTIRHFFCRTCGVKTHGEGSALGIGQFVAVNISVLDNVSDEELAAAPLEFQNGRNNNHAETPAVTRHM